VSHPSTATPHDRRPARCLHRNNAVVRIGNDVALPLTVGNG
jgi:hypothetical protein